MVVFLSWFLSVLPRYQADSWVQVNMFVGIYLRRCAERYVVVGEWLID